MGEVIEKSQPENNIPQPSIEHTQPPQPIESNEGMIYDTELEATLKNTKNNTGFSEIPENKEHGWIWNGYLIKILGGTKIEIKGKKYNMTPVFRKVLVHSKYETAKSMNDMDKVIFRDFLQKTNYHDRIPTKGRISGRDKCIKTILMMMLKEFWIQTLNLVVEEIKKLS